MRSRNFILVIMIVMMLCISIVRVQAHDKEGDEISTHQYQAPIVEERQMLPDPLFNSTQDVVVEGAPDNFGWTHTMADGSRGYNNLSLTWNHTAGDSVNFKSPGALDPNLPESYDFIYVKQTFEWSTNAVPDECIVSADVIFSFQYDFDRFDDYIKLYIWLIDSSGDWIEVRETDSVYTNDFNFFGDSLDAGQINDVWGGLIQDESGIQTDPDDTLTLAVGFAPSLEFANHTSTVNGSVTMTIRELSLRTYYDQIRDHVREPDVVGIVDTTSIMGLYGLDAAPDGSLYTISSEGGYDEYNYDIVVQKWSPQCVPLWSNSLRGPDIHVGRDFRVLGDGSVLVLGTEKKAGEDTERYPMLARWNAEGELTWKHVIEELEEYRFYYLAVALDGSIFIGGSYDNLAEDQTWAALAKLNQAGSVLWTKSWTNGPLVPYTQVHDIIVGNNGTAFVHTGLGLYRFEDSNPVRIRDYSMSLQYYSVKDIDSEGNLVGGYFDYYTDTGLGIFKMDQNGIVLWNSSWGRDWNPGMDSSYPVIDLEVGVDGSIYSTGAVWLDYKYYFYIVKWNSEGTVITDAVWTYDNQEVNVFSPGYSDNLAIGSNGFVYMVSYMLREQGATIQVSGFNIGPLGISIVLDPTVRIVATIAVSSIGIVILMHLVSKRGLIKG
ncbi:MAG: hypothetical protein RTS72_01400 [Candidatus Thorarchaeota archaeon]